VIQVQRFVKFARLCTSTGLLSALVVRVGSAALVIEGVPYASRRSVFLNGFATVGSGDEHCCWLRWVVPVRPFRLSSPVVDVAGVDVVCTFLGLAAAGEGVSRAIVCLAGLHEIQCWCAIVSSNSASRAFIGR